MKLSMKLSTRARRTATMVALAVTLALGTAWLSITALGAPETAAAASVSSPTSAAGSSSAGLDPVHHGSCIDLSNAPYDMSSQDSMSRLQGAMNASIASLPQHDPLAADVLAAEGYLVLADTDLLGVLDATHGYASMYHDDVTHFSAAMMPVESDCQGYGVTFQADVSSTIL